jgi:hypothetical protein
VPPKFISGDPFSNLFKEIDMVFEGAVWIGYGESSMHTWVLWIGRYSEFDHLEDRTALFF